jgi:class 3 adenylate cyclase
VAAVGALKTHAPLQTRVGIATGLVVVGDLIGSGASQEQAIVGETPNLAARLQGVAEPNSVVIAGAERTPRSGRLNAWLEDLGLRKIVWRNRIKAKTLSVCPRCRSSGFAKRACE